MFYKMLTAVPVMQEDVEQENLDERVLELFRSPHPSMHSYKPCDSGSTKLSFKPLESEVQGPSRGFYYSCETFREKGKKKCFLFVKKRGLNFPWLAAKTTASMTSRSERNWSGFAESTIPKCPVCSLEVDEVEFKEHLEICLQIHEPEDENVDDDSREDAEDVDVDIDVDEMEG